MDPAGGMDWQAKRLEGKVFTVRFIDSAGQINRDLIVPVMADLIGHLSDYQMPGLGRA